MKKAPALVLIVAVFAAIAGAIALSTPASAATKCWQVECNTCCRGAGGVVCTQRACV